RIENAGPFLGTGDSTATVALDIAEAGRPAHERGTKWQQMVAGYTGWSLARGSGVRTYHGHKVAGLSRVQRDVAMQSNCPRRVARTSRLCCPQDGRRADSARPPAISRRF